ncbi:MAG: biotin/lipoyl-containing protein, partial [Spirochaetota bacterium]
EVPVRFHTHDTAGTGVITYKAAIEAGADGIDLSLAPVSGGTSQPDVITMWHALRGTEYDLGIDITKVMEAEEVFKDAMKDYFFPPEAMKVEPLIPFSPMPGGALTANTQMMRDHKVLHRFPEVIAAMREVVERGGFGTSVTPVSQFYFQQAFNNVVLGPWKKIADGYGKMLLGYFGKTPTAPDPELVEIAAEQLGLEPTTESPRELNDKDPSKGRKPAEQALKDNGLDRTDENVFIAATCKDRGIAFLKGEGTVQVRKVGADTPAPSAGPAAQRETGSSHPAAGGSGGGAPAWYTVTVGGETFEVKVSDGKAEVNGDSGDRTASHAGTSSESTAVTAPMPGVVMKVLVKQGESVKAGQAVVVMECMKMEMNVEAETDGRVGEVKVTDGQNVEADQVLVTIA